MSLTAAADEFFAKNQGKAITGLALRI